MAAFSPPLLAEGEPGHPVFTDVAEEAGLTHVQRRTPYPSLLPSNPLATQAATGGAAVGDFFGDGLPDIFVTRHDDTDILYRNMGDGTFSDVTEQVFGPDLVNGPTNGAMFADLDNDGALDLYVTSNGGNRHYLYMNDGNGRLSEQAMERGVANFLGDDVMLAGTSVTAGDYNRDGSLDLYVSDWSDQIDGRPSSRLFRNRGDGYFDDVTEAAGLATPHNHKGFGGRFADMNRDGVMDLVTVNDFRNSEFYLGKGDGTFDEVSGAYGTSTGYNEMGSTVADYTNNGYLDWFATAIGNQGGNRLYRNEIGRGLEDVYFSEQSWDAGVRFGHWGWGTSFIDFDNNGLRDLLMVNGWDQTLQNDTPMRFWRNKGPDENFTFERFGDEVGLTDRGAGRGVLTADFFNNGYLDVLILNHAGQPVLYRNSGGDNNWLRIDTVGEVSNRMGIGALITVKPRLDEDFFMVHDVNLGANFLAHNETTAHFGLGDFEGTIDYLHILWPSGLEQEFFNIEPNQLLRIHELDGIETLTATPLPEPGTLVMLTLAGALMLQRRHARSARPSGSSRL